MPTISAPSRRLATATRNRHDRLLSLADAAGVAADRRIVAAWSRILDLLKLQGTPGPLILQRCRAIIADMQAELLTTLGGHLTDLAVESHQSTARVVQTAAPKQLLTAAVTEAAPPPPPQPGMVRFGLRQNMRPFFQTIQPPEDATKDDLAALLFPPPSQDAIAGWLSAPVNGTTWVDSIRASTSLAMSPDALTNRILGGFSQGKNPREIANDLRPLVQGVQSSARRIARTYGMAISHEASLDAYDELGDMVIGYMVHSQRDRNTRSWHAERDGTEYFKAPTEDQKGLAQMPRPPLEAEDASERPAGTPHTAYNCRCWLSPILRSMD